MSKNITQKRKPRKSGEHPSKKLHCEITVECIIECYFCDTYEIWPPRDAHYPAGQDPIKLLAISFTLQVGGE